jgi:hypothetical protein
MDLVETFVAALRRYADRADDRGAPDERLVNRHAPMKPYSTAELLIIAALVLAIGLCMFALFACQVPLR